MATDSIAVSKNAEATSFGQGAVVALGRLLFAVIFVMAGANHFNKQTIGYAASQGCTFGLGRGSSFWRTGDPGRTQHFAGLSRTTWGMAHRAVLDSSHADDA